MARPSDEGPAAGSCCGACEHGAHVANGTFQQPDSDALVVPPGHRLVLLAQVREDARRYPVMQPQVTIGRVGQNAIAIPDDMALSRVACEVAIAPDGSVTVRDLNSSCGTWVGDRKVGTQAVAMRVKDTIVVGRTRLTAALERLP